MNFPVFVIDHFVGEGENEYVGGKRDANKKFEKR